MQAFNAACNFVSGIAWQQRIFNQVALHHLTYRPIRQRFGLPAQLAVRAIAKVAHAYKTSKAVRAEFRPLGAITYDRRVLRLLGVSSVSCSTLRGRITVPLKIGGYQRKRLAGAALGETKLVYDPEKDRFSFVFSVKQDTPSPADPDDFLGIDMGVKNAAADSDGTLYTGGLIRGLRKRHLKLRRRLQAKGTKAAKRLLKKRRRKEARFHRHINHCISQQIVAAAKGTGRGVAIEDLTHIRSGSRLESRSGPRSRPGRSGSCVSFWPTSAPTRVSRSWRSIPGTRAAPVRRAAVSTRAIARPRPSSSAFSVVSRAMLISSLRR